MARLNEEIARFERMVLGSEPAPETLLHLAQLYRRAGRLKDAAAVLERGRTAFQSRVVRTATGEVAGVDPTWEALCEAAEQVEGQLVARSKHERRMALTRRLESPGGLEPPEHDELIRLEVEAGVPLHPETPSCPACRGPVARLGEAEGGRAVEVRCARSGRDGDLCRHTDAQGLVACPTCGLVLRPWNQRRLRADPHEPPTLRPEKARCPFCQGGVADWRKHFLNCPKARPGDFPRCPVCHQRGFHERPLRCERCHERMGSLPCLEKVRRRASKG